MIQSMKKSILCRIDENNHMCSVEPCWNIKSAPVIKIVKGYAISVSLNLRENMGEALLVSVFSQS